MTVASVRKAIVASVGALLILLTSALEVFDEWIGEDAEGWVTFVIALLTAVSVYLVRNAATLDQLPVLGDDRPLPPATP